MKINKQSGFTLAETLITLTIIGVIAAMTVPTLMSKYQKHTYVVGLKKAYAQIKHALQMVPITEGCSAGDYECAGMFQGWGNATDIDGLSFQGNNSIKNIYLISKNLKTKKFCPAESNDNECKKLRATMPSHDGDIAYSLIQLEDGAIFSQYLDEEIDIDINGLKGPNLPGRDIFRFIYNANPNSPAMGMVYPQGSGYSGKNWKDITGDNITEQKCDSSFPTKDNLYSIYNYCAGRVLEENAMNY